MIYELYFWKSGDTVRGLIKVVKKNPSYKQLVLSHSLKRTFHLKKEMTFHSDIP